MPMPFYFGGPVSIECSLWVLGPYASGRFGTWLPRQHVTRPAETLLFGDAGFVSRVTAVHLDADAWREDPTVSYDPFSIRMPTDSYFVRVLSRLVNRPTPSSGIAS